jgi:two-component system chemotaxis sensor kinase CheA
MPAPAPAPAAAAPEPVRTPATIAPKNAVPAPAPSSEELADTAVRVDVGLLDRIMNLVGELVLARNQLLQAAGRYEDPHLAACSQAMNAVTTSLQEHIVRTRMQPIGNLFAKFPRVVRDLSRSLGKKIDLEVVGKETELDRTILEAMRDPFTHLLRNSCDHGIETPEARTAAGKPETGRITIRSFHEGGQVVVEVVDDGKGIDGERVKAKALAMGVITPAQAARMTPREALGLICHPGLSTAEKVTEVSGRGVGMDVVRSNIEAVGGSLDIQSEPGRGSTMRIRIPLTLAIIPALMVRAGGGLYGIPQAALVELVGVEPGGPGFEQVRGAEVFRLRERLLTIVRLDGLLGTPRSAGADAMVFIAVVAAGDRQFGLVVDEILDTEEIVVKPLSKHLAPLEHFAGATIRGDGNVAVILDIAGVARRAAVHEQSDHGAAGHGGPAAGRTDSGDFLVFHTGGEERFAVPLNLVARIEQYRRAELSTVNGTRVICHGRRLVPVIELDRYTKALAMPDGDPDDPVYAIVLKQGPGVAILARELIDNLAIDLGDALSDPELLGAGPVLGLAVVEGRPVALLDVPALLRAAFARRPAAEPAAIAAVPGGSGGPGTPAAARRILYCEDAQFFQNVVAGYLGEAGYRVTVVGDGRQGIDALESAPEPFDLVLTDLEMPVLDGWGLIKHIRSLPRWDAMPVIALTSLADEAARQRTLQAGADRFAVKIEKDRLLATVAEALAAKEPRP